MLNYHYAIPPACEGMNCVNPILSSLFPSFLDVKLLTFRGKNEI